MSPLDDNFNVNISVSIDGFNSVSKKTYSDVEFIEKKLDVSLKLLKSSPIEETNFRFLTNWLLEADNFYPLQTYLFYIPNVEQCH
jgi:hypothetical protein